MPVPGNADHVTQVVVERLDALNATSGVQETVSVEWRGQPLNLAVISMPIDLLSYNPDTHRIRAQRTLDPAKDLELTSEPFGPAAQAYLQQLLMADPAHPAKTDPSFTALQEDLQLHGQTEPGIITRSGVLINGNTRCAALRELDQQHIRVGVLPPDAGHDDILSVELALQLRKEYKRDYSFMNFLLAIDERSQSRTPAEVQKDFRIKAGTYERSRWILIFVKDAIQRSTVTLDSGETVSMRLVNFEEHQGKLEELYRSYTALKTKSPNEAEALREQRLLAIVFDKSKTDLRLIEADFASKYMKESIPKISGTGSATVTIPGTGITAPGPSAEVEALRKLTTEALQERAIGLSPDVAPPEVVAEAAASLTQLSSSLDKALELAGKQVRVIKKRFAASDRLSDANDVVELAIEAVAEARSTGNFKSEDLDDSLIDLRGSLRKLAQQVARSDEDGDAGEGVAWLKSIASNSEKDV